MERLNDILARTKHSRTQGGSQQSTYATPSQSQRPGTPRRPLREQTAHIGQVSRSPRMREHYQEPRASGEQVEAESDRSLSLQQEKPQALHAAHPRQRFSMHEPGEMISYAQQTPRTVQDFQRSQSRMDGARSLQGDDFVSARDRGYSDRAQADVQEEWEDDTADMRYGDWENGGDDEKFPPRPRDASITAKVIPATSRTAQRISQTLPSSGHHLVTRELHSLADAGPNLPVQRSQYITRDLRDVQMPSENLAAPQSFLEEPRRSHRFTQPLKQQRMARINENMPPDGSRVQQSARRDNTQEPSTQLIPAPYTSHVGVCPICKGAGYLRADVPFGHPNFGRPIACECKEVERKEKRRRQLQDISNLGDVGNKSFDNFRPNVSRVVYQAYQTTLEYAQDPQGWLVLIGPNGCGKTHLAAAIANQYLEEGALVLFVTVIDLLEHLRATFAPTSTVVYDQLFSRMREAALLVLDDLGAHQSSPWANEKLFQLLNYRYNLCIPTIITMNNSAWSNVEERIRSRMSDFSLVTTVRFDGAQDYRPHNPRHE